jgi:hypothetical protein
VEATAVTVQLGTVGEWFSGLATAGALWVAWRVLSMEQEREKLEQASQVAVWAAETQPGEPGTHVMIVALRNGSDEPVYDLSVECDSYTGIVPFWDVKVVAPGQTQNISKVVRGHHDVTQRTWTLRPARLAVEFRDSGDRRWRRDYNGRLRELPTAGSRGWRRWLRTSRKG